MTTPIAKNRKATPLGKNRDPSEPKPIDPAESVERVLRRLGGLSLGVQTEPLREMRLQLGLDMQVVYFAINMPIAGGIKLRLPVLGILKPRLYSPTREQRL
jgi:hypothetical protein